MSAAVETTAPHESDGRVGTIVAGRYRIESVLGRGGVSTVYRATHLFTGRKVAVKLLLPQQAADPILVDRFLREARAAGTLGHAHVVDVLDMGVEEGNDVYLVMELVEGRTLHEVLADGPLAPARIAELLLPVMEALGQAHALGIVHRDIKPDNVVIGDRGDGVERAIVIDFGIAKVASASWLRATQAGYVLGTPHYMSPEQCEGGDLVGPRADVWSMGVVLYECLSGQLPFHAPALTGVLTAIATNRRLPLSTVAPRTPPAWAAVVERALALDPLDRFPDLTEMAEALRAASTAPRRPRVHTSLETTATGEAIGELPTQAPPPERRATWSVRLATTVLAAACVAMLVPALSPVPIHTTTAAPPTAIAPSPARIEITEPPVVAPAAPPVVVPTVVEVAPARPMATGARRTRAPRVAPPAASASPRRERTGLVGMETEW